MNSSEYPDEDAACAAFPSSTFLSLMGVLTLRVTSSCEVYALIREGHGMHWERCMEVQR